MYEDFGSIWVTALLVYLIVFFIDFVWMNKVDKENQGVMTKADYFINLVESMMWPILLPLEIIFFLIITVFSLTLESLFWIRRKVKTLCKQF